MSGETEASPSGWSIDTVKAHFDRVVGDLARLLDSMSDRNDRVLNERDRRYAERFDSIERAHEMERENVSERMEKLNELRDVVSETQRNQITRDEVSVRFAAVEDRIGDLKEAIDKQAGGRITIANLYAAAGALAAIVTTVVIAVNAFYAK